MAKKHDYSRDTFFGSLCELSNDSSELTLRETLNNFFFVMLVVWFTITFSMWIINKSLISVLQAQALFIPNIIKSIWVTISSLRL